MIVYLLIGAQLFLFLIVILLSFTGVPMSAQFAILLVPLVAMYIVLGFPPEALMALAAAAVLSMIVYLLLVALVSFFRKTGFRETFLGRLRAVYFGLFAVAFMFTS